MEPPPKLIDGFGWSEQFNIYVMRSQYRSQGDFNNNEFGYIHDCGYSDSQMGCYYSGPAFMTASGVLILTPTIFNPKPVALANITPAEVFEGCSGSPASTLTFRHNESFHPNPESQIVAYQWDVDQSPNGGGLWWENNGQADFEVGNTYVENGNTLPGSQKEFRYTYQHHGEYTATLRVVDSTGQEKLTEIPVSVLEVPNEAPSVNTGGPYILEAGQDLVLNGSASDNNTGCGDTISIGWEINGTEDYNDLNQASGTIPWARFQNFTLGQEYNIKIRAIDSHGEAVSSITQLTIYPKDPVAVASILPNPSQCQQEVTFNASNSYHLNPNRQIVQYEWDIDSNLRSGFDGGGANPVFTYAYSQYGTYTIRLRVTDQEGNSHEIDDLEVNVNQGNSAPIARVAQSDMVTLEEENLVLDASPSFDSNVQLSLIHI